METDDSDSTRVLSEDEGARGVSGTWPGLDEEVVELNPGDRVGRYAILERIGSGGMGVVYAAEDPDLGREVALKLLRPTPGRDTTRAEARGRLIREAQAMAKLSHPNVLPIFDVGSAHERVFLAMELVRGQTLGQWRTQAERTIDEILATLTDAGRGLAAAHAAGLVHRDFKPSNVLVGDDGRVHVMDFGLARSTLDSSVELERGDGATGGPLAGDSFHGDLTRTGFVMGTPAYMAPEQHRGAPPDPHSDQWSFCVTLYEALFGERPFRGRTRGELAKAIGDGALAMPSARRVPAPVRAAVRRGLSADAAERFASMNALLAQLARPPRSRGAQWASVGLGVTGLAGVSAWITQAGPELSACHEVAAPIEGVWGTAQREALSSAFAATGVSWAPASAERAGALLDDYATSWTEARVEVCEAGRAAGADQDATIDLQTACLDRGLGALDRAVRLLSEPERQTVDHAVEVARGLPDLAHCRDAAILRSSTPPPTDPAVRVQLIEIEAELDRAEVLQRAARYDEALELARGIAGRAEATGHAPTQVHARRVLGSLQLQIGDLQTGLEQLESALWLAEEHGMDRDVAKLATSLLTFINTEQHRQEDTERWAALARAKIDLVEKGGELEARLTSALADAADARGDYGQASARANEALTRWEALAPGSLEHANAIANLARTHFRQQHWARADAGFAEAAEILTAALGEGHPSVTKLRGNRAVAAHASGDYARARDELLQVLPRLEELFGRDHQSVALTLNNLGNAYYRLGDYDEALKIANRSLSIKRELHGEGRNVAYSLNNVAMVLLALDRFDDAAARYEEAIEMLSVALGPDHPALAKSLEGLGELRFQQGKLPEAEALLRRATALEAAADTPAPSKVIPTFLLARVLWDRQSRAEALELARKARRWAADTTGDERMKTLVGRIDTWLAERTD